MSDSADPSPPSDEKPEPKAQGEPKPKRRWYQYSLRSLLIFMLVAGVFLAWLGYKTRERQRIWQRGYDLATQHWSQQRAIIYKPSESSFHYEKAQYIVEHNYDSKTGLRVKYEFHGGRNPIPAELFDGYKARIAELLAQNGIPPWSVYDNLVDDNDMVKAMTSHNMKEINQFPHDVTDNLVVRNGGSFSRWGYTSSGDAVFIEAKRGGTIGAGGINEAVFISRKRDNPNVIFIRIENGWLGVFDTEGHYLSSLFDSSE